MSLIVFSLYIARILKCVLVFLTEVNSCLIVISNKPVFIMNTPQEVVDLERYVKGRDNITEAVRLVNRFQSGSKVAHAKIHRQSLAKVIVKFCRSDRSIQVDLGISDEQLAIIDDGGEIPPPVVEAFSVHLKAIRNNVASHL